MKPCSRRLTRPCLLGLLLPLLFVAPCRAADGVGFSVSPTRLELVGKPSESVPFSIELAAPTTREVPLRIALRALLQREDGTIADLDPPEELRRAVRLSAEAGIARKGRPAVFKGTIRAPSRGTLAFGLMASAVGQGTRKGAERDELAAGVGIEFRFLVVGFVRATTASAPVAELELRDLSHDPACASVRARLVSHDERDREARGEVTLIDPSGPTVVARSVLAPKARRSPTGRFSVWPRSELVLESPLAPPRTGGRYLLRAVVEVAGRKLERRLTVDLTAPPSAAVAGRADVAAVASALTVSTERLAVSLTPGAARLLILELSNGSHAPLVVALGRKQGDEAVPRSALGWVELSPETLTLPAGGRRKVAVVVRVPQDTAHGEYQAAIEVDVTGAPLGSAREVRLVIEVREAKVVR